MDPEGVAVVSAFVARAREQARKASQVRPKGSSLHVVSSSWQ